MQGTLKAVRSCCYHRRRFCCQIAPLVGGANHRRAGEMQRGWLSSLWVLGTAVQANGRAPGYWHKPAPTPPPPKGCPEVAAVRSLSSLSQPTFAVFSITVVSTYVRRVECDTQECCCLAVAFGPCPRSSPTDGRANGQAQEQLVVLKGVAAEKEKAEESAKKAKAEADKVIEGKSCVVFFGRCWSFRLCLLAHSCCPEARAWMCIYLWMRPWTPRAQPRLRF